MKRTSVVTALVISSKHALSDTFASPAVCCIEAQSFKSLLKAYAWVFHACVAEQKCHLVTSQAT